MLPGSRRRLVVISIHAPREGCDYAEQVDVDRQNRFQSTHPVRGATGRNRHARSSSLFQSTHPVRGATRLPFMRIVCVLFQSTHPVRGATRMRIELDAVTPDFNPRTP